MSDQQKKWAAVGLLCVALIALYYFLKFEDQKARVDKLETEVNELARKINEAKVQVARLDELRKEMEVLNAQWEEALDYLPTSDEIEVVLKKIDDAMNDSNLKSQSFLPGYPEAIDFYSRQRISLQMEGDFKDFLQFLDDLEQFERIVHPSGISVRLGTSNRRGQQAAPQSFTLTINMSVLAYIQGEGQTS